MQIFNAVDGDFLLVGQGFNSISATQGGQSVVYRGTGDLTTTTGKEGGFETVFRLEKIESLHSLREKLNISASASCGFGIYSGDAASSYFRSRSFNSHSVFVFVDVLVLKPSLVLKQSLMSPAALKAADEGLTRFLGFCGDNYVYGYQAGGQLTAIAEFTSKTANEFEQVSANVEAAISGFGGGGVSFNQTLETLSKTTSYSLTMLRKGTHAAVPDLATLASVAQAFPTEISKPSNQVVVKTLLRGYETTENFPSKKVDVLVLQKMAQSMEILSGYLEDLYEAQGDLQFIGSHLNWYKAGSSLKPAISNAFAKNEDSIALLLAFAVQLRKDPLAKLPPPPNVERVDPGPLAGKEPPPVIVEIFEHINYGGRREPFTSSISNLANIGFNDAISSFKIHGDPGEYEVEFYLHINYEGLRLPFQSPAEDANLTDNRSGFFNWNDQISSIKITKKS
ncbi:hypothetical protein [Agrobacterium tumefaciens]|uniref:hypothetical protein n=1 Tax=Agrobacterium tumefaciens TaxID=358 RepID=UPI00220D8C0D|nr:beta/gamma crystallin family protein [Agrobacterium tumefaciens]